MARCTGFAAVQILLNIGRAKQHAWRAAINDAANTRPMRLAK
jgi:alpha-D-ribose 1-methylphosphonate 5-triphosphate synthase subunit PhnG